MRTSPGQLVIPTYRFESLCSSGEMLHAMRYHWFPKELGPESEDWYQRDYLLIGLVVAGQGELTDSSGCEPVEAGSWYAVAPKTPYRLRPHAIEGLVEMRVIVHGGWLAELCERLPRSLPWQAGPSASLRQLDTAELQWYADWVEDLMADQVDLLAAEAFMLSLLHRWRRRSSHATAKLPGPNAPAWLRAAVIEMTSGKNLQDGISRLVQLAGHSRRHVNRLCRQYLGCSSTAFVNGLRIEYAARRLRMSDDGVAEIAARVGLTNRSYFTRLFTEVYGVSPGVYRQQLH